MRISDLGGEAYLTKILILDDHPDSRITLAAIFESSRFGEVLQAGNPEAAIRKCAQTEDISLLVCDVVLVAPMSGIEAARVIRDLRPEIPILFTSGTPLEGISAADFAALRELVAGRVDYIQKPFSASELVRAAGRLLAQNESPGEFVREFEKEAMRRERLRGGRGAPVSPGL
jgi:CheY-like chemotaxis protein